MGRMCWEQKMRLQNEDVWKFTEEKRMVKGVYI